MTYIIKINILILYYELWVDLIKIIITIIIFLTKSLYICMCKKINSYCICIMITVFYLYVSILFYDQYDVFGCQRDTYIWNAIALSEKKDIDMGRFITNKNYWNILIYSNLW